VNNALAVVGAVVLVYVAFNATIGLMRRNLADVEAQLGASPGTVAVRSSDLCTMLAGEGWRRHLQSAFFPWPMAKANALRARWRFEAEPDDTGAICGKYAAQHVLRVTARGVEPRALEVTPAGLR
jgi:hypothetical protein